MSFPTDPPPRPRRPTRQIPPLPTISVEPSPTPNLPVLSGLLSVSPTSTIFEHTESIHNASIHDDVPQTSVDNSSDLTPVRAHYLKKSLIQLQFRKELDAITSSMPNSVSALSYLGLPFTPPPKNGPVLELPFLRFIFRRFVLTFPFLAEAPKDFFPGKLQPFALSMSSRNLSPVDVLEQDSESTAQASRLKLLRKVEKSLSILLVSAVKLVEPEHVVRLTQMDLNRLEELAQKRLLREKKQRNSFEVNIVCVRTVVDKGRVRSKAHDEFIIRTRRRGHRDIFVSRRYGDFKTLATELKKAHPEEIIRQLPAKDRTYVASPSSKAPSPYIPRSPTSSMDLDPGTHSSNSTYLFPSPSNTIFPSARLSRERNRLTLRGYLYSLLASSTIASSPVLRSFLTSGPTHLSPIEVEDAARRVEADQTRDEGRKKFAKEIAARVDGLREAVKSVKGDLVGKDGLTTVFGKIKATPDIRQLPPNYQAVVEWARITLASTVFHHFVATDDSSETFASLKRIHGMMPYFMLKTALKISNPIGMIRSVLDLFLAQPFGGRSLLQRMFSGSLTEEVKVLEEEIELVKDKVDDPMMCEKVRVYVNAPPEIQAFYKEEAAAEGMNLLTFILRSSEQPLLSRPQMHRVAKSHRAYQEYLKQRPNNGDSDDDDGPQDEDAWLFEDLALLAKLYSRLRDREQLIALIFEGVTSELLKDIITIFYAPLAQVYKAASISDSLGDLQNFINDLIRTVEQSDELSQENPQGTVQRFIDLIQRHEQMFYSFVHKVHTRGSGLFDNLMRWIELIVSVMREGLGGSISLEFLLPHTGDERQNIMKEVDEVATYHYKLKLAHESKVRRRFGRTHGQHDADSEDQATAALVESVVRDLSLGELIQRESELIEEASSSGNDSDSPAESDSDDETDDSDEETSGSESPPLSPPPRARTLSTMSRRTSSQSTKRPPVAPHSTTKSSFEMENGRRPAPASRLRSSRSLNFHTGKARSPMMPPVPPPPIPQEFLNSQTSQKLPRSVPHPLVSAPPPNADNTISRRSKLPHMPDKRKKSGEQLQPPQLHYIPQLLPVFVEMLAPRLRRKQ